ncbi:Fc receptor-like protein 5 [Hoplias malabaricus]|uniref:Fc receptor-like protein 5 n=1 Tax=Hoplias malabaricus TaxID=27720 RepID=UPI003462E542
MRRCLQPTEVARVVQLIQDGISMRTVARRFAMSIITVSRAWRRYQETGQDTRRRGRGCRRATTQQQDHYLLQRGTGGEMPELRYAMENVLLPATSSSMTGLAVEYKPKLKVQPQDAVFTGDTVTLSCETPDSTGWEFYWYKNSQNLEPPLIPEDGRINRVSVTVSTPGETEFQCAVGRPGDSHYSSDRVQVTVRERPTPTVKFKPAQSVFIGERVTLTCDTQSGVYWDYEWKNGSVQLHEEYKKEYEISKVEQSHAGDYTCKGKGSSDRIYTHTSAPLTLTVSEKPKPTITSNSKGAALTGNTVTLICTLGQSDGWTFSWFKGSQRPVITSSSSIHTISSVSVSDRGQYWCRAQRGSPDYYTYSDGFYLDVTVSPKPVLYIAPDKQVFRGETVTLRCVVPSGRDTEWKYIWFKDYSLYTSRGSQEITVRSVTESNSGKYTCRGERKSDTQKSEISAAVTLTVSEIPQPTLTSSRNESVLRGNPVTLNCTLGQSAGWTFYWSRDTQSPEINTSSSIYTISSVSDSNGGQYRCRAGRGHPVYYTHYSDALWVNVTDNPTAVVSSIKPDEHVFKGENVTLRCDIEAVRDTEWNYIWFKDNNELKQFSRSQEITVRSVTESNSGKYTCRGERKSDSQKSEISAAVTLTVSGEAQAVLSVSPQSWLTEGDSVTLSCEVNISSKGWTFSWYRAVPYRQGLTQITDVHGKVVYSVELLSDSRRGAGGSYTLSPAALYHTGVYVCGAERGEPAFHTQYSSPQPLWITGNSPPVSLIISPSRTQHFITNSLSLSCEGHRDSAGWRVRRYTHSEQVSNCSSVPGFTCNISSLSTSDTGVYWCQSESGERSDPVNITVHNGDVILESPVHSVSEGDSLTLRCLYRSTKSSLLPADFYKDGVLLQKQTTGEMTIHKVSKADEGLYHCKHPEKGESPRSWISVRMLLSTRPLPHSANNPTAVVSSIKPDVHVFKGENVTLRCDIEAGGDAEWNYIWFKDNNELKQFSRSQEITVRSVTESNSGKYTCRGERKSDSQKSEISAAVTLTLSGNSPPVSLIISPSRTQHFSTDSLSLSCEGHRDSAGWRVRRYTHSDKVSNCSSVPGFTCNISSLSTSDTGVYWCQSESGESSDPVNITVHNGAVILESPVHSVSEGDSLTLRCLNRSTNSSHLPADFYQDGVLLQEQTTEKMTIHKVSKSHEGLYHCKHAEEGESPRSWISGTADHGWSNEGKDGAPLMFYTVFWADHL